MKTILNFFLFSFLFLPFFSFSQLRQGELNFPNLGAYSVIQSIDDGYVFAGWYAVGNGSCFITKLDSDANLKWTTIIGGATISEVYSVTQTRDGGYVAAGYTSAYGAGGWDVYVIKLDSIGNLKWTKTIGGPDDDWGNSIIQTTDGGFAITGGTESYGGGVPSSADIYVIKLDSTGNKLWTKTIEGPWGSNDEGRSIIQTTDGGYAVAGSTFDLAASDDVFIFKLDSLGNLSWANVIGGTNTGGVAYSVIQTNDKGYAITGYTESYGVGIENVYVVKLDSTGNLSWTKTIGGTGIDVGESIVQTKDSGYAIAGVTNSFGPDSSDVYMIKLDSVGNLKWTKVFGEPISNIAYSLVQSKDEGYVLVGYNDFGGYFLKLNSLGNTCSNSDSGGIFNSGGSVTIGGIITSSDSGTMGSGGIISSGGTLTVVCKITSVENINPEIESIEVNPNPNNGQFTVSLSNIPDNYQDEKCNIEIYNVLGEKVLIKTLSTTRGDDPINIGKQPNGVYLYRVIKENGNPIGEGKLIIQK